MDKTLNCEREKTQKLKWWQKSTFKIVRKNSKTQVFPKLKKKNWNLRKLKNLNLDQFQLKVWQIFKTQTRTKFNNFNCDKTQELKLWLN